MNHTILLMLIGLTAITATASEERDERLRCACIEGRLDQVQTELRRGYREPRGKHLRERQRKLEDDRRRECR